MPKGTARTLQIAPSPNSSTEIYKRNKQTTFLPLHEDYSPSSLILIIIFWKEINNQFLYIKKGQ